jgi:hypothetical protein
MPVGTLLSHWAYTVMAALGGAQVVVCVVVARDRPVGQRYAAEKVAMLRLEFKTCLNAFIRSPVQVVRTSRRLVFRLLEWNPCQAALLRGIDQWHAALQC